jgi:hypothetical protein
LQSPEDDVKVKTKAKNKISIERNEERKKMILNLRKAAFQALSCIIHACVPKYMICFCIII